MKSSLRFPGAVVFLALALVARAALGPALQTQLGNPSNATTNAATPANYLIARPQYALSYNDTLREPNWVSWDFTSTDRGDTDRTDAFAADPLLPAGFHVIDQNGYRGSGFDRGHMCPSADRTLTVADNEATFYMTNMVPQTPDNNQGVWGNFEQYTRDQAALGNEVLNVCGPSGFAGATIATGVAIPGFTWKITVILPAAAGTATSRLETRLAANPNDPAVRVIALKIPNIAGVRSTPWANFTITVSQIETDTGFVFFSNLPPAIATALRVKSGDTAPGTDDPAAQRLLNLSTRARAASATEPVIAGFVLAGDTAKEVLIRAVGPTLGSFGVPDTLTAPRLELVHDNATVATNTGWRTASNPDAIAAAATRAGAFSLGPTSADSALLVTLAAGNYTAIMSPANGQPGVGLIEIYDVSAAEPGPRLINLSTRATARPGADALIAGFVIGGGAPKRVLLRAAGPALAQFGLGGLLARPQLTVFSGATVVAQNAGWSTAPDPAVIVAAAQAAGAFPFGSASADSALVLALAPGSYTAQVTGVADTTGLALVEVYELP